MKKSVLLKATCGIKYLTCRSHLITVGLNHGRCFLVTLNEDGILRSSPHSMYFWACAAWITADNKVNRRHYP